MTEWPDFHRLWQELFLPLTRLLIGMSAGLFLASFLEHMGFIRNLGAFFSPVTRLAHFGEASISAFIMAFASPATANGILSEAWRKGEIGRRELTLASICNSFPASLAHLPSIFLLAWPVLGAWSLALAGINLAVAACRTLVALVAGRFLFPVPKDSRKAVQENREALAWSARLRLALKKACSRFTKRLRRLALLTIPCFILVWLAREGGLFELARVWLSENLAGRMDFLGPAAISIVLLQMLAETGASLGAAGALLETGTLSGQDIVAALLLGGILATPLRAARHQFPSLAGFFNPAMALWLVIVNQGSRALFMTAALAIFLALK